ncbi:MAG: serine hydrolase domain-containing protein [Caldilineaceae bacterium]
MSLPIHAPESVGFNAKRLERIKPAMQKYVDQVGFAGVSSLLARRGKVIHFEQVGWQDREAQVPLAPDTIYRIYSMTKPIICTALMTLYEEGKFQLFEPVMKYIPAFARTKVYSEGGEQEQRRPMQIRDLFTYSAGLTYDFLEDSPVGELYRQARPISNADNSLEQAVRELARLPLAYQPGSRWHYSVGIDVLAQLIQVISGQPLQDFLAERLFRPLGMVDTAFYVPDAKQSRLSAMYGHPDIIEPGMTFGKLFQAWLKHDNQRRNVESTYPSNSLQFARGGHGLYSTAADYLRFAQMLLSGRSEDGQRILGRRTLQLMHSNHLPPALLPYELNGIPSLGYGFGLGSRVLMNVAQSALVGSVGEFGWAGAAKTYYWVDPVEEIVGVLMTQYMVAFDLPDKDFQLLAYQALED